MVLNYFEQMLPPEELKQLPYLPTIPEFLTWINDKWGELPAVSDSENVFTYHQFCERIACKRALLSGLGLSQGDCVAIQDRTTIDAIEMFLAVTSLGCVALMLPAQLPADSVRNCCSRFGVAVLALGRGFVCDGQSCKTISTSGTSAEGIPVVGIDKNAPAAIFFTGGTTGAPKGAVLPHRAIMRGALNGCYAPGHQLACHRYICFLPLSHVFGLIRSTLSAFYSGAEWFSCEDMKQTISKIPVIKPTILVLVPGLCEVLMELVKMYGRNFLGGELKTIIAGAANVPPKLIEEYDSIGIQLFAGYGMTEAANLTSGNVDVKTKPTSVGRIYPHQQVKIVDGEIWIKGDNLFLGYYGDKAMTDAVMTPDGWLKTGDLGRFDDEGYLYIVGRSKNVIILSNGENVSPERIEEYFYKVNELRDCLVYEESLDGKPVLAIDILPRMDAFEGREWQEVEAFFSSIVRDYNKKAPLFHRIAVTTVRKDDFKRTGTMKVSRNQS